MFAVFLPQNLKEYNFLKVWNQTNFHLHRYKREGFHCENVLFLDATSHKSMITSNNIKGFDHCNFYNSYKHVEKQKKSNVQIDFHKKKEWWSSCMWYLFFVY